MFPYISLRHLHLMCMCTVSYNLQLHCLAIELDRPDLEVHTNGRNVALGIGVVGEPQQQARFPNARVANQQQLEEEITARRRYLGQVINSTYRYLLAVR